MRAYRIARVLAVVIVLGSLLVGVFSSHTAAQQSEFLSGEGMPYDAFDRLPQTDVAIPGAVIHIGFAPGDVALPRVAILDWINSSARAVSIYYGRFPVRSLRLLIVPVGGAGVRGGTTWGYRGGAIRILLGEDADANDLRSDWIMVHEMVHLALPDMSQRYNWLSEGLAVYIEPIARTQAGDLTDKSIWAAMIRDMPKGLPHEGDKGLDNTPTWGRTYWGGALFCLLADVEIRRRTGNGLGLQDAMRGVLAAGGNHEVDWPIRRILTTADKATGLTVLTDLYDQMRDKPVRTDLPHLWTELGLKMQDDDLEADKTAPLAAVRAALTKPPSS